MPPNLATAHEDRAYRRAGLNVKAVVVLLLVTLAVLYAHNSGLLDISLNVLDQRHGFRIHAVEDRSSTNRIRYEGDSVVLDCDVKNLDGQRFCGITILTGSSLSQGLNLSMYDSVTLDVEQTFPKEDSAFQFYLRNYDEVYATEQDPSSLKFNSVFISPQQNPGPVNIPFNSLQVSTWWIDQHKVHFEDAQVDLSNVAMVEVLKKSIDSPGHYRLKIHQLSLHGELISGYTLTKCLFALWLLTALYLIHRQKRHLAIVSTHDCLTGILNRRGLHKFYDWIAALNASSPDAEISIFYIDIDGFKKINDTYGHRSGDQILKQVCDRINQKVYDQAHSGSNDRAEEYCFARISGDEFVLLFWNVQRSRVDHMAQAILECLRTPFMLGAASIHARACIGMASTRSENITLEELIGRADAAMYFAKRRGGELYQAFDDRVHGELLLKKKASAAIGKALEDQDFYLLFMPIYRCDDLSIAGAEVLIRCNSKYLENLGPDKFIPVAEENGLIQKIDLWVFETTLRYIREHSIHLQFPHLVFSINISARELRDPEFPSSIAQLIAIYQIDPGMIEVEITETSLTDVDDQAIAILEQLKELGVAISLDDFGTGYTAFNQLLNYPVDTLKIDRTFVQNLGDGCSKQSVMVDTILSIAKSYKLKTIAEGVEDENQYRYLRQCGCDYMQGYYRSRPMTWDQFCTTLEQYQHSGQEMTST